MSPDAASTHVRPVKARVRVWAPGASNGRGHGVEAYAAAPGLIVHKTTTQRLDGIVSEGQTWTVTHEGSGRSPAKHFRTRKAAITAAVAVAGMVDWTIPTVGLMRVIKRQQCMATIVDALRANGGSK